jgi:hypothetical protein
VRRRRRQTWASVALFAVVGLVIAFVGYIAHTATPDPTLSALCGEGAPSAHTVVLLDSTDPLTETQRAEALRTVTAARERLGEGERLSLYVLRAPRPQAPAEIVTLFSRCRPRDGSGPIGPTDNPRILKDIFEADFARPAEEAIAQMIEPAPAATTSPIVEALHQVATSREFAPAGADRELIIISDLLQKSEALDQYSKSAPKTFDRFRQSNSQYLSAIDNLAGMRVRVLQLSSRYPGLQTPARASFWEAYFKAAGVREYQVTRF